jgi:hypothetical protein
MNYHNIYNRLINRAKLHTCLVGEYYESHHIIPRCLGGTDRAENLVNLTAREHFIAHLCLLKMYPNNNRLVRAAVMMACNSASQQRSGNRIYEWLRKKHSVAMSEAQAGDKNSQFGSLWIFSETLQENKKIKPTELEHYEQIGWRKGRVFDFNSIFQVCVVCNVKFRHTTIKKTCSRTCNLVDVGKFKKFAGREEELKSYYAQTKSMNKALKLMGYPGAVSHYYAWAKLVLLDV